MAQLIFRYLIVRDRERFERKHGARAHPRASFPAAEHSDNLKGSQRRILPKIWRVWASTKRLDLQEEDSVST